MNLGPIAYWVLQLDHHHIALNPATNETNHAGIFAIGDIAHYQGKLKLILTGFSEAALAAHTIRPLVYPDEALHWESSTTRGVPAGSVLLGVRLFGAVSVDGRVVVPEAPRAELYVSDAPAKLRRPPVR